jgi:prepilin-type N-terminal cleavage/methylation domain-containing protein
MPMATEKWIPLALYMRRWQIRGYKMKQKRGFTLTEVLIVSTISMLIMGALYGVSSVCRSSLQVGQAYLDLQRQAARAMDRMARELYMTESATVSVLAPGASSGDRLILQIPTVSPVTGSIYDINDNINWGDSLVSGQQIMYLVPNTGGPNDGRLVRRILDAAGNPVVGTADTILADYITNITFNGFGTHFSKHRHHRPKDYK